MPRLSTIDVVIFIVYMAASVLIGVAVSGGQRTLKDYFLASRGIGYVVIAISVIAAFFSGITYLAAPTETYYHGIQYALGLVTFFIATPITIKYFLPVFYRLNLTSAYEYLERRFDVRLRTLASALFILRVVTWLAIATYAPALAVSEVTGMDLRVAILSSGLLTTLYTTLGGMRAVIWTDVFQFFVLFGGQVAICWVGISQIDGGFTQLLAIADAGERFKLDFSPSLTTRITMWGVFIGLFCHNMVQLATDQVGIQRYLTAPNLREARKSLWLKLALTLPVAGVFYFSGLVLFAFYHQHPERLGHLSQPDRILPHFVVRELPVGMPGALIAAIFAATMSTISAGINSLTTASLIDFDKRLVHPNRDEASSLRLAKWLTVFYGLLVTVAAFGCQYIGQTIIEQTGKAFGLLGGPLLGAFFLGLLSRRATATGTFLGVFAGLAGVLFIGFGTKISWIWYSAAGCATTMVVGYLLSLIIAAPEQANVEGLTVGGPVDEDA